MRPGQADQPFTSDLSVNEFLLVREAGFRPLGLVLGSSIYHVGFQLGRWSKNQELDILSQAMYHARELAMTRMEAEADVLGADGIVGVRLDIEFKEFGSDLAEFIAVGTAVKADHAHAGRLHLAEQPATSRSPPTCLARTSGPAAGRLRAARHGDGHLRLPHRPPAVLAGDRSTSGRTSRSRSSPRRSTTPASSR